MLDTVDDDLIAAPRPLPTPHDKPTDLASIQTAFERFGGTDVGYLGAHLRRFLVTKELVEQTWLRKGRVLDLGAHWLHQSYLYARDGYEVTAADFPATLTLENVRAFSAAHGIRLAPFDELESGKALRAFPDDSFDLVLFTEIIDTSPSTPSRCGAKSIAYSRPADASSSAPPTTTRCADASGASNAFAAG